MAEQFKTESEKIVNLDALNDGCLLNIFNKLSKYDYWNMRKVCKRFNDLLTHSKCPPFYNHLLYLDSMHVHYFSDRHLLPKLAFLIEYMSDVAEQVEVDVNNMQCIELLSKEEWVCPKVHTLEVFVEYKIVKMADIIVRGFPNLRQLIYIGELVDGSPFGHLPKLKEISFDIRSDVTENYNDYISTICQRSQLTAITIQSIHSLVKSQRLVNDFYNGIRMCANTLEKVAVSSQLAIPCLRELNQMSMSRLQRFIYIDNRNEMMPDIYEDFVIRSNPFGSLAERVYRCEIYFDYLCIDDLSDFRNLEQLIITVRNISFRNIHQLSKFFPNLTEVECREFNTGIFKCGDKTTDYTLSFLTSLTISQKLKILSIPIDWIGKRFELSELLTALREQHNRSVPLELRCLVPEFYGNDKRVQILQNLNTNGNEELLQISLHDVSLHRIPFPDPFEIHMKCLNEIVYLDAFTDDCLLNIFNKLSKYDYWRMRKVCKRFNELLTQFKCPPFYNHLRRFDSVEEEKMIWIDDELSLEKLKYLLEYMSDVAELVEVKLCSKQHIELLSKEESVCPKVHVLKVFVEYKSVNAGDIIVRAFPNLKRLDYTGYFFDGSPFGHLRELKEINLDTPFDFKEDYNNNISTICERCELTAITIQSIHSLERNQRFVRDFCNGIRMCANTLEKIAVSSQLAISCLRELSQMTLPRLQRFIYIDNRDKMMPNMYENFVIRSNPFGSLADRVYRFESYRSDLDINDLSVFRNLQQLSIYEQDISLSNTCIQQLPECFPNLTEFYCWNLVHYIEDDDISHFFITPPINVLEFLTSLTISQKLKILSIPIEWIDSDYFELSDLLIILREQHNRTVPLELRCLVSESTGNDERVQMLQNLNVNGNEELLQSSLHDVSIRRDPWNAFFEIHMMCLNVYLDALNDDCLLNIFNKLSKYDYWRMRKVCKRFNDFLTDSKCPPFYNHWYCIDSDELEKMSLNDRKLLSLQKLKFLLEYMSDVAELVEVEVYTEKHIELLSEEESVFPNVHTLSVIVEYKSVNAADIIVRAFPNLRQLKYRGELFDGAPFADLPELKELKLHLRSSFTEDYKDYISIICQRSQLTAITIQSIHSLEINQRFVNDFCNGIRMCANTLEKIAVSSQLAIPCLRELSQMAMPCLQRFIYIDNRDKMVPFMYEDFVIRSNTFGSLAERVYRCGSYFNYLCIDDLSVFRNLEQLTISDKKISFRNIQQLYKYFPNLTEVECWNSNTRIHKSGVITTDYTLTFLTSLTISQKLKMLSIPIEWIGDRFELSELLTALREQHNRSVPLELRCLVPEFYGNDERVQMLENLNVNGNEELLKISLHDLPIRKKPWDTFLEIHMKCLNSN